MFGMMSFLVGMVFVVCALASFIDGDKSSAVMMMSCAVLVFTIGTVKSRYD